MELTILGTSSMVPTKDRNHSAVLLSYKSEGILIDCGEGTQRQIRKAGISPGKITKILISHWHGDHVFGLPGLLQTMSSLEHEKLQIYGPAGTKRHVELMFKAFKFRPGISLEINEVERGVFFENKEFELSCLPLEHSVPCLGFRFQEKDRRRIDTEKTRKIGIPEGPLLGKLQNGRSITWKNKKYNADDLTYVVKGGSVVYICDTVLTKNCIKLAQDAVLLISESSYADDLKHKAEEYRHMTASDAAKLASSANVKKLIITHFSQRYKSVEELEDQAKTIFPNTVAAYDFMKVRV